MLFTTGKKDRVFDSNILTLKEDIDLYGLIQSSNIIHSGENGIKLIHRGSMNNFSCKSLHEDCDNKHQLIVLVYTEFEHVFGGYTKVGLDDSKQGQYITDKDAFLFLLRSSQAEMKNKTPIKFNIKNDQVQNAIYTGASYGLIFGSGHDLVIYDKCNINNCTSAPGTFDFKCADILGGKQYFKVKEIELFQVV